MTTRSDKFRMTWGSRVRWYRSHVLAVGLVTGLLIAAVKLDNGAKHSAREHPGSAAGFTNALAASQLLTGFSEHGARVTEPLLEQYRQALDPYFEQYEADALPDADNEGYTLVLQIRDEYLNDPETGILARAEKKGVSWERPGVAILMNGGHEVFRSPVGVRMHGGFARHAENKFQISYRLYFRPAYRSIELDAASIWPEANGALERMVILKTDMDLHTALSFDVARRLNLPAPYMVPMRFFINDADQRTKLISEHLGTPFLEARFGRQRYDYFRRKDDDSNPYFKEFQSLVAKWKSEDGAISLDEVESDIDLDALLSVYLMQMFIELYDSYQGMVVRRHDGPDRRWFFVPWDLEGSLLYNSLAVQFYETHPDEPRDYFSHLGSARLLTREEIWRELRDTDVFRQRFARATVDALNHLLTDEWLNEEIDHYQSIGLGAGLRPRHLDEIEELRGYLTSRRDSIFAFLSDRWELGPLYQVEVGGPQGVVVQIDGYPVRMPYRGRYLRGMDVVIDVGRLGDAASIVVDEQRVRGENGRFTIPAENAGSIRIDLQP